MSLGERSRDKVVGITNDFTQPGASLSICFRATCYLTTGVFNFTVEFKNNRYHLVYLGGKKKKTTA
jgi:hypothetical protein